MKILVLGGTGFLGPEIVESLLGAGHTVTLFNRGRTHPHLFPDLEKLIGDRRAGDLKALEGREWDVVIDVFASHPKWVKATSELLSNRCKTYVFISTISVYDDNSIPDQDEEGSTYGVNPDLDSEDRITNETYGPMKVRCEAIVREHFPKTATVVRPGLIVGPTDPTDRFTYWPARIDRGGDVLTPGPGSDAVQFIDVRDLGRFVARLIDDGHVGTYNATGPSGKWTMAEFLAACKGATATPAQLVWVDPQWLMQQGVQPFMEVPLWAPGAEMAGFMRFDCSKAVAHGLSFRPLSQTAKDTMDWAKTRPDTYKWQAGLDATREQALLKAWREQSGATPSP
jgi:2'-hydroxyisoflavone reductase